MKTKPKKEAEKHKAEFEKRVDGGDPLVQKLSLFSIYKEK